MQWHLRYRDGTATWNGEYVTINAMVRGGVDWSEYARTWVEAMWCLRRAVLSA